MLPTITATTVCAVVVATVAAKAVAVNTDVYKSGETDVRELPVR